MSTERQSQTADAQSGSNSNDVDSDISELKSHVTALTERVRALEDENVELTSELQSTKNDLDRAHRNIAELRSELTEIRGIGDGADTTTELGVALQLPPEVRESYYTVAQQRAVILAQILPSIGGTGGAKIGNTCKRKLERHRDESLQWAQVYRSCEALESISEEKIVFITDGENRLRIDDESVLPNR